MPTITELDYAALPLPNGAVSVVSVPRDDGSGLFDSYKYLAIAGGIGVSLVFLLYADLIAQSGTVIGESAAVIGDPGGSHVDPVSGETVPNDGVYSWTGTEWQYVGDLESLNAADAAARAEAAALAAEGYANAALAMANVQPDIATGLANTPSGGYFSIVASDGSISIYQNDSGSALFLCTLLTATEDHLGRPILTPKYLGDRSTGAWYLKALYDVQTSARLSLTMFVRSDSMGLVAYPGAPEQIARFSARRFATGPVFYMATSTPAVASGATNGFPVTGSFTTTYRVRSALAYPYIWGGTLMESTAINQFTCFGANIDGGAAYSDVIRVYLHTYPGAPKQKIQYAPGSSGLVPASGSGAWVNPTAPEIISGQPLTAGELIIDCDAAAGMIVVVLQPAAGYGQYGIKVIQTTAGTGRYISPFFTITTRPAFNIYRLSQGSDNIGLDVAGANPYMVALLDDLSPDVAVVASDDNTASYQSFLPLYETAMAGAGLAYDPLTVFDGNGYSAGNDTILSARNDYLANWCGSRIAYMLVDGMSFIGGQQQAVDAGIIDQTHPWEPLYGPLYTWALDQHGFDGPTMGPAAVKDTLRNDRVASVTSERVAAVQATPTVVDTGIMTWTKLASSAAGASVTVGASKNMLIATAATAANKVTAFVDDGFAPLYGSVGLDLSSVRGMGVQIRPAVSNATGIMRVLIANDRSYNGVHKGAITANGGYGFKAEDLTFWGIVWNGTSEVKSPLSWTGSLGRPDRFYLSISRLGVTLLQIEWFAGGWNTPMISLGTRTFPDVGTILAWRVEMENGATAADYQMYVTPPIIASVMV